MLTIFPMFTKPPGIIDLPLKPYRVNLSLDKLAFGVDNIHIDVHISQHVSNALKNTAWLIMIKHARVEYYFKDYKRETCESEKDVLKNLCADVLQDAIHQTKINSELQIDHLGQIALVKMFLEEVKRQHKNLVAHFEKKIRMYPLSLQPNDAEKLKTQTKLAEIKLRKNRIIRLAGKELFQILTDVQTQSLRNMRETHFPPGQILPDVFFNNPVLHTDNPADDFFLIEEYVLFGKRSHDPDNYDNVQTTIYDLLDKTDLGRHKADSPEADQKGGGGTPSEYSYKASCYDPWIMEPGNIDLMFNFFELQDLLEKAKREKESGGKRQHLQEQIQKRQHLLNFFYETFKKSGLMKHIMAVFEMKSIYGIYCPPMAPRQIREFLIDFWSRRSIKQQLKRLKSVHGGKLPLAPLKQSAKWIKGAPVSEKKAHLISFLHEFSRYHRDLFNASLLAEAMDAINLITEENILQLSRSNRSLYEFLLPAERVIEGKAVRNHVILKADIRGSIQINHIMRTRRLNVASHFSLNFFDPISEILWTYDASKVFIEGDAIILSIFEYEDSPDGWYSVARACGLALRILHIVQRYNVKNSENNLPILELGIGISYSDSPPAYLFDGDSSIMISPAINMADRLSSCNKKLRRQLRDQRLQHNLYVFKNVREDDEDSPEDISLRYNVNGIELSEEGFVKLSREINLKKAHSGSKGVQFYAGKVPLLNGLYQQLVVRETPIYEVNPETLSIIGETPGKYYEICTRQEIYEAVSDD